MDYIYATTLPAVDFWQQYLKSSSTPSTNFKVGFSMPGNPAIADHLVSLYLSGKKTAGSGLVKDYKLANEELPKKGDYWTVLDAASQPRCILKTVKVEICPFLEVGSHVAVAEGEGDLTIEYWRKVHREFFEPLLESWGITDLDKEEVVTEFYEMVYR